MKTTNPIRVGLAALVAISVLAACGGSSSDDPGAPGPTGPVSVAVTPATATLAPLATRTFAAAVTGATSTAVTWRVTEASGGTVDASGLYTAPAGTGTFHVVATSVADPSVSGSATVTVTANPPPPADNLAAQFDVLSRHALYFDHASVGENLMDGVAGLLGGVSGPKPTLINMNESNGGVKPDLISTGVWAESMRLALWNGDPMTKIREFRSDLDKGVGTRADIAWMKFCFVDFNGGTNVDALFASYQSMITAARAAYPSVRFVHFTAPLETGGSQSTNAIREAFSARIRAAYGADVFDLARWESTWPDGTRETSGGIPALVPIYTNDSGHLNATGQAHVVPELVRFLANLN
jgi:hypothetical protein